MKVARGIGAGLLALLAALGCGGHTGSGVQVGGETNWLIACNADSECSLGQCLCNVCTLSCAQTADCGGGPSGSSCVSPAELPSSCGEQVGAGLCLTSDIRNAGELSTPAGVPTRLDQMLGVFLRDLEAQPAEAQPFTRYFSVANSGPPDTSVPYDATDLPRRSVARSRRAVAKMVNSLSRVPVAAAPAALDADSLYYRIDLRAYGWDRPITVDGVPFADGWEAIVAHAQLALEYRGAAADPLAELSGSNNPWLFGDDFINAVAAGSMYYELLGLPGSLTELQAQLESAQSAPAAQRAAFEASGNSTHGRVVERRELANGSQYWQAFDYSSEERGSAVFTSPLELAPDATQVIFSLPNGLNGFFLADADGRRVAESSIPRESLTDPAMPDGVMRNAVSCFSCHNAGLVPFVDEMRDAWSAEVPPAALDPARVLDVYPPATVLAQALEAGNAMYVTAAEGAGVEPRTPDGVSFLYLGYQLAGVDQARAAEELFTTKDQIVASLADLPLALFPLRDSRGEVARDAWVHAYHSAMCTLQARAANRPEGCP